MTHSVNRGPDGAICEAVQRNLRSRSYQAGRYSARQERSLYHFHRLYHAAMEHP